MSRTADVVVSISRLGRFREGGLTGSRYPYHIIG
jgi:hypothetical protein